MGDSAGQTAVMTPEPPARRELTLLIEGMTCAACAARIEKKLNRIDHVAATVNYATHRALVFGESAVDRSMMTGESLPADVTTGDAVLGGTVVLTGRLVLRAAEVGADTQLARAAGRADVVPDHRARRIIQRKNND